MCWDHHSPIPYCTPRLLTIIIIRINAHLETEGQRSRYIYTMWPEALPPFIIIATCVAVTGMGLGILDRWQHGGKVYKRMVYPYRWAFIRNYTFVCLQPRRVGLDAWDRRMMRRDKRITGSEDTQRVSLLNHDHLNSFIHYHTHTHTCMYIVPAGIIELLINLWLHT